MKTLFRTSILFFSLSCFFGLPSLAQWSTATLSQSRIGKATTSTGNKAFFAGGYYFIGSLSIGFTDQVDIYNANTNQWSTTQLSQARGGIAAASIGNLAFFAGGSYKESSSTIFSPSIVSDRVDVYDATTNQWTKAQLSQARNAPIAAAAGGKILFAGGSVLTSSGGTAESGLVDIYDISTNQWSTTQLPRIRGSNLLATSVGNKLLFTKENDEGIVDIYDVLTGQWSGTEVPRAVPPTYLPIRTVTSVGNRALFVEMRSNYVYIYDVVANIWTTALLSGDRSFSDYIQAVSLDNKAYFSSSRYSTTNLLDIYDATTNQWSISEFPSLSGDSEAATAGNKLLFAAATSNGVNIYTTNSALPVNLVSFTGKWTENIGAQLAWQTSLEINNDHFQIQRSSDAKSFETIGRVQGKGTTTDRTDYSFTDADMPDPVNYYRLKQVDLDGSTHLSSIVAVNRQENKQLAKLSVWPTPTTGTLTIQLSAGSTISEVSVYDLHGRRLSSQIGAQSTTDVSGLQTGAYVLDVLTTHGQHLRQRFVK